MGGRRITIKNRNRNQKKGQKQPIPSCTNENKMNYGSPKQPSRKFYDKNQVRQVVSNTVPPKMTNDSIEKRKVLGFKGPGIICFLCGSPKHVAPKCKIYPNAKPTNTPCKCNLYHAEAIMQK